ncbi:MAG: prepilin-type N-terminal cleavage/methylation domain-containing protein [Candidatus Binatia bacterium]
MRWVKSCCGLNRGFTLLEILVAMTIVGLGVVTLLEVFSSGLRLGARSQVRTEAITYGRQIMDEILARHTLRDGTEQGMIDQTSRWKLEVQPVRRTERLTLSSDWELKEIALDIIVSDAGREGHVEFKTLRLVKKGTR